MVLQYPVKDGYIRCGKSSPKVGRVLKSPHCRQRMYLSEYSPVLMPHISNTPKDVAIRIWPPAGFTSTDVSIRIRPSVPQEIATSDVVYSPPTAQWIHESVCSKSRMEITTSDVGNGGQWIVESLYPVGWVGGTHCVSPGIMLKSEGGTAP